MIRHITDQDIAEYVDDLESPRRAEIDAHTASCADCHATLEAAQQFDAEMDAALIWDFMSSARSRRGSTPLDLIVLAEQIEAEEREAREYLTLIIMSPRGLRRASLSEKPSLRTAGVVRVLCEASLKLTEQNPKHALAVADLALEIAGLLDPTFYDEPARTELHAASHLQRARALRLLGRFPDALEALDASEDDYRRTPLSEEPLALVKYVRSGIFMKSERVTEALQLAQECAEIARRYGNDQRVVHARIVTGCCLFLKGEYKFARDIFRRLIPMAQKLDEPATVARCLNNLAKAELELGEHVSSLVHFSQAEEMYERLGLKTEILRSNWGAALVAVRMGRIHQGIARLRAAADQMLALGMTNDHALVMLDVADALFAIGNLAEVPSICAGLVRVFGEANMAENARMALAYLDASVRDGVITEPLIRSVKNYLDRENYASPFIPPAAA